VQAAQFLAVSGRQACVRIWGSNFLAAKVFSKSLLPAVGQT